MKTWALDIGNWYDDELRVVTAKTREQARYHFHCETGVPYIELRVTRLPAMDDVPLTPWNFLTRNACGWYECGGCYKHIYPGDPPYAYADENDPDEDEDGCTTAVEWRRGDVFHSAACLEQFRHRWGWRYVDV